MLKSGKVQPSTGAGGRDVTYVTCPPNPAGYKAAPPGSVFVEFEVPETQVKPGGTEGWRQVVGPKSPWGTLAARHGEPFTSMPIFLNPMVTASK